MATRLFFWRNLDIVLRVLRSNQITNSAWRDTLKGGEGTDTYKFNRGDDQDVIDDHATDGVRSTGRLQFGTNIAHDQLWSQQSGNDLLVDVIGISEQATVENWYSGTDYQIEEIEAGDGYSVS